MLLLLTVSLLGVAFSLLFYCASLAAAFKFGSLTRAAPRPLPARPPRFAILKPIRRHEEGLESNLRSFFELDYPSFRIVLGVPAEDHELATVIGRLSAAYPAADLVVVTDEEADAANRKVARLIRMMAHAEGCDLIAVSDADISVSADYLRRLAGELLNRTEVGITTCIYRATHLGSFASRLQALSVNTDFAPMVMLSALLEPVRHAFGATIALKRAALEAIGGFRAVKDVLADDFYIGRLAAERGFLVELSSSIVTTRCTERTFLEFWNRQLRWFRTYRTTRPVSVATILINGPLWALLLILASGLSPASLELLVVLFFVRAVTAWLIAVRLLRLRAFHRDLWLVPIKDLLLAAVWLIGLLSNRVQWGGRRFVIMKGGLMRELAS
jgi:ceramide glucosyltransferase